MVVDFNSKPVQGKLFYVFCDMIMGISNEEYAPYKEMYIKILKRFDLYYNEEDLDRI